MKKLGSLSWRVRGSGATCTTKKLTSRFVATKLNPENPVLTLPFPSGPEGQTACVSWILCRHGELVDSDRLSQQDSRPR